MSAARIPFPRNGLISYHYFRNRDVSMCSPFTLIADSGAYSAKTQGAEIKLPDLCAWANDWREHFAWVAALDVIGDPVASRRNWEEMRRRGVPAVPTIHFPEPPSAIDSFAREGVTFIGLGGQVGGLPGDDALGGLGDALRPRPLAADALPRLGYHQPAQFEAPLLLGRLAPIGCRGRCGARRSCTTPATPLVTHRIRYDGRDAYRPEIANLLSTFYGTDPASVATSDRMNWDVIELQARSASVWESHLQAAHGVIDPPARAVWSISRPPPAHRPAELPRHRPADGADAQGRGQPSMRVRNVKSVAAQPISVR